MLKKKMAPRVESTCWVDPETPSSCLWDRVQREVTLVGRSHTSALEEHWRHVASLSWGMLECFGPPTVREESSKQPRPTPSGLLSLLLWFS